MWLGAGRGGGDFFLMGFDRFFLGGRLGSTYKDFVGDFVFWSLVFDSMLFGSFFKISNEGKCTRI